MFARTVINIKANYINGFFPEGAQVNSTRLAKTEEILKIRKIDELYQNFRIMIQVVIKCSGRSTDKRIQENSNVASLFCLYSNVNERWITWRNDLNKILDKYQKKILHKTGSSGVTNITLEREENKNVISTRGIHIWSPIHVGTPQTGA